MNKLQKQTALWRYMDVARFLALIDQKELYFPRLHELQNDDAWEGAVSPLDPALGHDRDYMHKAATDTNSTLPMVSCWHENETESVAMWKLYVSGREGVAIKTTVASLIELLSVDRQLKLGRVVYRDIEDFTQHQPQVFTFERGECTGEDDVHPIERTTIFRKNKGYAHEQEVRALIYETYDRAQAVFSTEVHENMRFQRDPEKRTGMGMPVDISVLIHEIVVSPLFPTWAIKSLQKAVDVAFHPASRVEVKPSILLDKPISHHKEASQKG